MFPDPRELRVFPGLRDLRAFPDLRERSDPQGRKAHRAYPDLREKSGRKGRRVMPARMPSSKPPPSRREPTANSAV